MKTKYFRDHTGWNGQTEIEIENERQLVIRTSKRSIGGGLATNATVWSVEGGTRRHAMGLGLDGCGDFSERYVLSQPKRVSESVVRQQHERVLGNLDAIRSQVNIFYEQKKRREEAQHATDA